MIRVKKEAVVNTRDATGKVIATNSYPYETILAEPGDESIDKITALVTAVNQLAKQVGAGKRADSICEDGDGKWLGCDQATAKDTGGRVIRTEGFLAALNNGLNLLFNASAKPTNTTRVETKRSEAMDVVLADPTLFDQMRAEKAKGGLKGMNAWLERYYDEHLAARV